MNPSGIRTLACGLAALALVAGCATKPRPAAPVVDRSPPPGQQAGRPAATPTPPPPMQAPEATQPQPDWRPRTYTVRRGDTLYGIALDHGLEYRELAAWNALENPNRIEIGQVLRLTPPGAAGGPSAAPAGEAVTSALKPAPGVEARPVDADRTAPAGKPGASPPVAVVVPPAAAGDAGVKSEPRAVKLPYSDAALAQLQAAPRPKPDARPAPDAKPAPEPGPSEADESVQWLWPTSGKVLAGFSENGGSKGLQIGGTMGQPVVASAAGRVVYSGNGLRGYGMLVIIKHNATFLTAYAHNSQILVKEGQTVARGQKIAEMGNSDADRVKLHFEIRRFGRPVDPAKFLPSAPS